MRFIPVHHFAEEGGAGSAVDAWCEFPTDVALVEVMISRVTERESGIWIRRDADTPHFLKVSAVLDCAAVTREKFEEVLSVVAGHPLSANGFEAVKAGSLLSPLEHQ